MRTTNYKRIGEFSAPHAHAHLLREAGAALGKLEMLPLEEGRTAGNLSIRDAGGFIITASGVDKVNLDPANLVKMVGTNWRNLDFLAKEGLVPSKETLVHAALYATNPAINSVIHVHDAVVLEKAEYIMGLASTTSTIFGANIEEALEIASFARHFNEYVNIPGHGQFSWGYTIGDVLRAISVFRLRAMVGI